MALFHPSDADCGQESQWDPVYVHLPPPNLEAGAAGTYSGGYSYQGESSGSHGSHGSQSTASWAQQPWGQGSQTMSQESQSRQLWSPQQWHRCEPHQRTPSEASCSTGTASSASGTSRSTRSRKKKSGAEHNIPAYIPGTSRAFSSGSKNHYKGMCRPCYFNERSMPCPAGAICNFCHFEHDQAKLIESEAYSNKRRADREAAEMASVAGSPGSYPDALQFSPSLQPPPALQGPDDAAGASSPSLGSRFLISL
eukprot:TRINITY_DN30000_c0_g1_i1.p1 TRINITY_DN30000_c0_g1~~TRINITY_DN30000_c0_g1_i1.p1  ORF type:complete len:253 (-),score=17.78 TRINITY_DN30000_c0_g1_i1:83-841(-)